MKQDTLASLRLENGLMSVDILPELGGKIWSLKRSNGIEWIWRNPHIAPKAIALGAEYDAHWIGGWEELFPNDAPGLFEGRELVDHGEWWSSNWTVEPSDDPLEARLTLACRSVPAFCEKRVRLDPNRARLTISYKIKNSSAEALRFLFKQHLPVAITPEHQLELPGGRVTPVDPAFSRRLALGQFSWPLGAGPDGTAEDLSRLPPPERRLQEFVYVSELPEGWCGVRDTRSGERLRLSFDKTVFPHTWLFMTFGGWRNLYTVVLEPCTNKPKDLSEALKNGACARLGPGETLATEVVAELS